jgi:putative transposase
MFRIPPGQTALIDGIAFRLHQITTTGSYVFENLATRSPLPLNAEEMSLKLSDGTLELPGGPSSIVGFDPVRADFYGLSQNLKEAAYRRHRYVLALQSRSQLKSKKRLAPVLADLAIEFGDAKAPSPDTAIRWLNRWERSGGRDIRSLIPDVHRRGNRIRRIDSDVLDLIEVVIDDFYYRRERTTAISVHEIVCGKILASNEKLTPASHLPLPSLATVRRAISDRAPYDVMTARKGKHAADRAYRPVKAGPKATKPLEVVEIDHTILDITLVDNQTGIVIGRPTMTAAIDKYSGMIVGFYLGYEPAANHTVMQCLRHAIDHKHYVKDRYPDIKSTWPCMGIPTTIVVDNGPEFHSEGFRSACAQLGINVTYAPGRSPWYKAKIERYFGIQNTSLLHQIQGTTFSRSAQLGDYKPEKNAGISLSDLQHIIHIWLIDYYSQRVPRLRGSSPYEMWNKGVEAHGITPIRSKSDLDCLLGGYDRRKLSRRGIEINNLVYCSDRIFDLRNRPSVPKSVEVRYDYSDLSYILVRDPITQTYIEIPSIEPEYTTGLTLEQHELFLKRAGRDRNGRLTLNNLSATRLHIEAELNKASNENTALKRKATKRLKRLQNTESIHPAFEPETTACSRPILSNAVDPKYDESAPSRENISFEMEE